MRIARDFGTVSEVLPDGIDDLRDCPHHVFSLIRRAVMFLSFEELADDERPPHRMWLDDEALSDHFKLIRKRRKEQFSGDGPGPIDDPVSNDAASLLIAE